MRPRRLLRHWKTKAIVQKTISVLPRSEQLNYLLQAYATGTARRLDDWYGTNLLQARRHLANWRAQAGCTSTPPVALELGTGWHVTVPLCLALWGVGRVVTVDRTSLLDPQRLASGAQLLVGMLRDEPDAVTLDHDRVERLLHLAGRGEIHPRELEQIGVRTHLGDAQALPDDLGPVDLYISNNVLEHVPADALEPIFRRYWTLASPGAVMSHFIDLADHYSAFDPTISSRNFLRYPSGAWRRWDNELVPQNRLQISDYRRATHAAGFTIVGEELTHTTAEDLARVPLAPEFGHYPVDELTVETAWLVSRA